MKKHSNFLYSIGGLICGYLMRVLHNHVENSDDLVVKMGWLALDLLLLLAVFFLTHSASLRDIDVHNKRD